MSRTQAGFTIVELLITIIIMVILLSLSVVITSGIQANARDSEREQDIATISRGLDRYYSNGNLYVVSQAYVTTGTYPGVTEFSHLDGKNYCNDASYAAVFNPCDGRTLDEGLNTPKNAFIPPGKNASERGIFTIGYGGVTNETQLDEKITQGYYAYIPYSRTGASQPCEGITTSAQYQPCSSFVLKYLKETTGQVVEVRSKRQ